MFEEYKMLDIYTVSFFGHRYIDNCCEIEEKVEQIVCHLINTKQYVDFLVGKDGDFDQIVSSCIHRIQRSFDGNSSLIWVLPYLTADYLKSKEDYEKYYNEIEICEKSSIVHPKAAIQIRNRYMVDRSDLVIFNVNKSTGGAYQTMHYAIENDKQIINLA